MVMKVLVIEEKEPFDGKKLVDEWNAQEKHIQVNCEEHTSEVEKQGKNEARGTRHRQGGGPTMPQHGVKSKESSKEGDTREGTVVADISRSKRGAGSRRR